jgi:hypothetical protein
MNVSPVQLFNLNTPSCRRTPNLQQPENSTYSASKLKSIDGKMFFAQMPNVSFGRYSYGKDDLEPYDLYKGPQPPDIEIDKFALSRQVENDIENENYLSAIEGKVEIAKICREQGKEKDAYLLEESIRKLYKELPKYQREEAREVLSDYNFDMAKYIDRDTQN